MVEGPHRFSIMGNLSTIDLIMDDKVLMSAQASEFFHRRLPIYLKIAAEVWAAGDAASGIVRDIQLESGGKSLSPVSSSAFEDRGLEFACLGNGRWEAVGKFNPSLRFRQYVPPLCK